MQIKFHFIFLLLIAQNAIQMTSSIALNTNNSSKTDKSRSRIRTNINSILESSKKNLENSLNYNDEKVSKRQILRKEKYHSQSFLEFSAKEKNKNHNQNANKLKNTVPSFSFGSFDFTIAFQLLAEILKNGILSENGTTLAQECFRTIYHRQSQFFHPLERFYSLMFGFFVSEKFLKNTQNANENFINAMNQIKKILDEVQDNYVILNGYRRSCFEAFKFVPNFNKDEVLRILIKSEYFGGINNTYGAQPFIDSQFSVYRDHLPQNAFKLMNIVSRQNGSGSGLIGNGGYDSNFMKRIMLDARGKGLNLGYDGIIDERRFGRNYEYGKKDYLYRPNITYDLGNKANEIGIHGNSENKSKEKKDENAKPDLNNNSSNTPQNSKEKKDDNNKGNENTNPDSKTNTNGSAVKNSKYDKNHNSVMVQEGQEEIEIIDREDNKSKTDLIDKSNRDKNNKKTDPEPNEKENEKEIKQGETEKSNHESNQLVDKAENKSKSDQESKNIKDEKGKTADTKENINNKSNISKEETIEKNNNKNNNNNNKNAKSKENNKENKDENDSNCMVDLTDNTQADATKKSKSDDNKHKNRKPEDAFNLVVFGNFGEIEYFKDLSKLAKDEFSNTLQKEKLTFDDQNNVCYINFEGGEKLELNSTKGLNNFNKLLAADKTIKKINAANSLFLIGDIVSTGINHEIYDSIEKSQKEKLLDRVQCAWDLFLDSLTKTGFAQTQEDGTFLVSQEVNILPGSAVLLSGSAEKNMKIFDSIQRGKNVSDENAQFLVEDERYATEQNSTKKKRKHSHMLLDSPKMTTLKFKDFYIQYLDFNSYMLICLSEELEADYKKCLRKHNLISSAGNHNSNPAKKPKFRRVSDNNYQDAELDGEQVETNQNQLNEVNASEKQEEFLAESESGETGKEARGKNLKGSEANGIQSNEELFSFDNAKKYAWKLHMAIKEKFNLQSAKYPLWKFMRAEHAPVSTSSGDSEFYFKMLKVLNEKGEEEVVTLIDAMQQKNVNLFISAQAKAAQVMAYPYTRVFKKSDCAAENKNKEITEKFGCAYTRHNRIFRESPVFVDSAKCLKEQKTIEFDLPVNFKTIDKNQTLLYVFNVGNSGAGLKKINLGKASNGYLIWERSIAQEEKEDLKSANYGFANFSIGKNYIDVKFYEMTGENGVIRSAMFSIAEQIMPDQMMMNKVIDENFCIGNSNGK